MVATAVILAAGQSSRMKSALPKALHPLAHRPMIAHLLAACEAVFDHIVVVAAPGMEGVAAAAAAHTLALQQTPRGTADAARAAAAQFGAGEVAILYVDNPLLTPETLRALLARLRAGDAALALLTTRPDDPTPYGRVVLEGGYVTRIVEAADATAEQCAIGLCNAGGIAARAADLRRWLGQVRPDNAKGEYYLTDVVALAAGEGLRAGAVEAPFTEARGINTRAELAAAEATVQGRLRAAALAAGVGMAAPETVFLAADTVLAPDVTIAPNVVFGPGVAVAAGAEIRSFSHLEGCRVGAGAVVGPFARLRPGTVVEARAHVGNFVELKAATLGEGAKANHLSYLGDATVGAGANIGAGTITCNYDGFGKYRTEIGPGAFIGSNSALVAPVTVGAGAIVAAGSVITAAVGADELALGRARQRNKPGAAAAFRAARQGVAKQGGVTQGGAKQGAKG